MLHTLIVAVSAIAFTAAALPGQSHQADRPRAAHTHDTERVTRVRLATGVTLDVAERGRPDGKPVVFLHGFTDSRYSFTPVLPHLPASIRAILVSQRGHGDSDRPACCYRISDFAGDVIALLDALGIERATVVGHSMGSFIAQRVAIEHPERVNRLVLLGSGLTARIPVVAEFNQALRSLKDPVPTEFAREFQQSTLAQPVPAEFFERVVAESGKLPARVWRDVLGGIIADSTMGDLKRVQAKTLIVSGGKDAYWGREQREALLGAMTGARLVVYDEVGHSPNWEQPARFAADLVSFLTETNIAPTRATGDAHAKRIRLGTGVELEVVERGDSDGEPVLFLHGFPDSHFSFASVADHLPSKVRAILPSQRGHGDSDRPACCYRIADLAADAVALLDALGISRATIVGHSLGSFVAQRIAMQYPERVNRMVLVGSGLSPRTKVVVEFGAEVRTLTDPISLDYVRAFQASTLEKPVPADVFDRLVTEGTRIPARVWRDVITALIADSTVGDHARIRARTLLISGEKDAFWDRNAQHALQRAISGARLLVYEGSGHSPNWEQPARFASDLLAFLAERTAPTAGPAQAHGESHAHAQPHAQSHALADASAPAAMPLLSGLGGWRVAITTSSPDAQHYFDQGLRLMYAFNHDEATRSFEQAIRFDSTCAMCHWGLAYALGPNINLPMDPTVEPRALAAAARAVELRTGVTPRERALVFAMAVRYGEPKEGSRAARDSAFARAMRLVAQRFPGDADVGTIFADAMMNLRPWNQWTRDGKPQPGTREVVASLERVMRKTPDHAGACHFYIHAIEASNTPEKALPCAERLPRLMPGAGHVVHMPAHVFLRVGRYEDAARANIAAVETDRRYFASREVPQGIYPMFYAPHNLHFLWASYLLSGQRTKAFGAARALTQRVKVEEARAVASLEGFLVSEGLTHVRFGDWDAVLAMQAPPADLRYTRGMWHYARGVAHAARGDIRAAKVELDSVRAIAARVPADVIIILNPAPALLNVATEVLAGRIAARERQFDIAIAHLRVAARLEDALTYDEPPAWYHSARNILGQILLDAGLPAAAESTFRDDLRYVRETGWSLSGLQRALEVQGKKAEAAAVARRLETAWKYADGPTERGR